MAQNKLSLFVKQERKKLGLSQVQGKTSLKMDNVNKVLRLFNAELGPVKVQNR